MLSAMSAWARPKKENVKLVADMRVTAYFLEAQRQLRNQNFDTAYELLNHCRQLNPQAAEVLYYIAPLEMLLNRDSVARTDMELAIKCDSSNYWYADLLSKIYFSTHRPTEAIALLEKMNRRWSDKQELMYVMLDAYASQNMQDSVLSVL